MPADIVTGEIVIYDAQQAITRLKQHNDLMLAARKNVLKKGVDFGVIPGTGDKPTLLKPGAEKLCGLFNFCPKFPIVDKVVDFERGMFYFQYECQLVDIGSGLVVATGIGSCNSREAKYRYRWIYEKEAKALGLDPAKLTKKEFKGNSGPYFKYRIDNDNPADQLNTIDKIAQKRALVAATLIGAHASEYFTQDIEDLRDFGYIDAEIVDEAA